MGPSEVSNAIVDFVCNGLKMPAGIGAVSASVSISRYGIDNDHYRFRTIIETDHPRGAIIGLVILPEFIVRDPIGGKAACDKLQSAIDEHNWLEDKATPVPPRYKMMRRSPIQK